jgi:tRNA U34 5-methylaminomethyl-2-thiouridine-forming methyltransferase MnmC
MQGHCPLTEIKTTEDGSSTLYRPDLDEHYHSIHGAIQESMHIFINAGLKNCLQQNLNILEIGFGTGLNALLTMLHAEERTIFYHAIEKWPLNQVLISKINYPQCLNNRKASEYFNHLHNARWNYDEPLLPRFLFRKEEVDLIEFNTNHRYDLVYFDAFGPDKQPELWTSEIFHNIAKLMNPEAILTTYSCKGSVKRAMQHAGLSIKKIPGPPGKREMVRACKKHLP